MYTRPVGRPPRNDGEPTKRKQIKVDAATKAELQVNAREAGQSLTDYLLQNMVNVIIGKYEPVTGRASLRPGKCLSIEVHVPLPLLAKIEDQTKLYGLTFTDFLLGSWVHRLTAGE